MATADAPAGDGGPRCARDFVVEKLREADTTMSPAELAEEYGCTNGHVRNLLSDLLEEGEVQRVAHGQYEATEDDEDDESPEGLADLPADSEGNAEQETDGSEPDETAKETPERVDGQAPSAGPGTEGLERPETAESMGVPLPVSANVAMGAVVVFLVIALWWSSRSSRSSPSSSSAAPAEEESDDTAQPETTLIEG